MTTDDSAAPSTTLRGIAAPHAHGSRDALVERTALTVEGKQTASHRSGTRLRILVDDEPIEIDVPDGADVCIDNVSQRGRWSKLAVRDESIPFRSHAPGPDAFTEIAGFIVRPGDEVIVCGDVLDHDFETQVNGHRDAPAERVSALRARLIAAGPDARRTFRNTFARRFPAVQRPARRRPLHRFATIVTLVVLSITLASSTLLVALDDAPAIRFQAILVASLSLATAAFAVLGADFPSFRARENRGPTREALLTVRLSFAVCAACFAGFLVVSLLADLGATHTNARLSLWFAALVHIALIAGHPWLARSARRDLALLLDSPPFARSPKEGDWGRAVGVVRDETPVSLLGEKAAVAREHDVTATSGSDPDVVKSRFLNRDRFLVDTPDTIFEVDPSTALWASTEFERTETRPEHHEREVVPLGAHIVVTGRVDRVSEGLPPRLEGRGTRSLIFFATRGPDPYRRLRALRRNHWLALAVCVTCAIGTALAAVHYVPELPEEREHGD